jgi:hypothetical protein
MDKSEGGELYLYFSLMGFASHRGHDGFHRATMK